MRIVCSITNCMRLPIARNLCQLHYQRWRKGKPLDTPTHQKNGSSNPNWRGGQRTDKRDGRAHIYVPEHPHASHGVVYRYRLVMEKHLGRYLLPTEVVHHKNGDCTDDHLENLEVITQSKHIELHRKKMQNDAWKASLIIKRKRNGKGKFI